MIDILIIINIGLSYGASISENIGSGSIELSFYRSSQLVEAFRLYQIYDFTDIQEMLFLEISSISHILLIVVFIHGENIAITFYIFCQMADDMCYPFIYFNTINYKI